MAVGCGFRAFRGSVGWAISGLIGLGGFDGAMRVISSAISCCFGTGAESDNETSTMDRMGVCRNVGGVCIWVRTKKADVPIRAWKIRERRNDFRALFIGVSIR
jgi:hypothetical protein